MRGRGSQVDSENDAKTQRENSRLRFIVEQQRKIAVDLANLLRKRVSELSYLRGVCLASLSKIHPNDILVLTQVADTKNPHFAEYHPSRVLDYCGDIGAFRDLFRHLGATCAEIDPVFAANGLVTMETPSNDVFMREGVDGKHLEFFANKVLPFPLRDTAEAVWDHFKGLEKHYGNGGLYEKAAKVSVHNLQFFVY
ncbi:unnamed protein product [Phytophthora fragariaefolia]|uniref:Unnamed protein product n=1 Tax=Phytophthora fragariaefolia TaxID=1490495 RepID=A0A9W6XU12_9STRA|nr:unnamed protein product [Phytophthora fragariaefolia]